MELKEESNNYSIEQWQSQEEFINFYEALFKKDSNFFKDFDSYLTYQKDSKRKENNGFKMDDFNNKLDKIYSNSYSISNKFYNRINISFELDYASTVNSACDIFFMLYNKMMDKICYNSNLLPYITELDRYIVKEFIVPCKNDLIRLAEFIAESDIRSVDNELKKFFNH